jgi:hypothetical protein|tara:strand:- start:301 stop:540 length:240 start_codon:yes stop_codon:yes gene_type:complete
MNIAEHKVDDFIANLKGRLNYETRKATKLGFPTIQEYVRDKLTKESEAQKLMETPAVKSVKAKSRKEKAVKANKCGCCP